ncbi:MAG: hypothetical protein ABIN97_17030 [Ginsengibacter sp.]
MKILTLIKKFAYLILVAVITVNVVIAQTSSSTIKPGTITKVIKFKPPLVTTFLGRNSQTADVTTDEANQLINLPLKITDDKNIVYKISSYQFMYKKKSTIENEQTGKREIAFTTVADLFKSTPLPQVWRNNIGGSIQKGEELYFFDIIVMDKTERKFYAPDLKIRIQ